MSDITIEDVSDRVDDVNLRLDGIEDIQKQILEALSKKEPEKTPDQIAREQSLAEEIAFRKFDRGFNLVLRQLLVNNDKIYAIKELRACTGLRLKDAKDWIEDFQSKLNKWASIQIDEIRAQAVRPIARDTDADI